MHYEALADSIDAKASNFCRLQTTNMLDKSNHFEKKNLDLYKLRLVLIDAIKIIDIYTAKISFNVASVFVSGK